MEFFGNTVDLLLNGFHIHALVLHATEDFLGCVAGSSIPTLNAPLC